MRARRISEYDGIINNARLALTEIAAESKINKRRVSKLVGARRAVPENAVPADSEIERDE
jgi:hypothetical protein